MKTIYLACISIMILTAACQKETLNLASPTKNNSGTSMVTSSNIKGVSMIKDGNSISDISILNTVLDNQSGWFLDLKSIQSNYNNSPKQPVVANLGDASLYCGGIKTINLLAGQDILMGTLTYANDATNLYVTYKTNPDWYMSEIHLYIGSLFGAPKSGGGTPSPGRFPIKSTFTNSNLAQEITYTIPLSSFITSGFIIAAHSSVIRVDIDGDIIAKETAWADGTRFTSNKNWATYITGYIGSCGVSTEGDLKNNNTQNKN